MTRFFFISFFSVAAVIFSSCKDKMICPAFQSTYILEDEATDQMFSLFGEDSLPKGKTLERKNRYGIMGKVRYRKRQEEIDIVKMKTIYPKEETDTTKVDEDAFVVVENDTLALEASNTSNVRYNNDQHSYMRYIGDDIAKAYEKKVAEYTKIQKQKEEQQALNPPKPDRKARKEERRKKKEEKKNKGVLPEEEEETDEFDNWDF